MKSGTLHFLYMTGMRVCLLGSCQRQEKGFLKVLYIVEGNKTSCIKGEEVEKSALKILH